MATTLNFLTEDSSLPNAGAAWVKIIDGSTHTGGSIESRGGEIEYAEEATASPPGVGFYGHILSPGEMQSFVDLESTQSWYARQFGTASGRLVVSPKT